MVLGSFVTFQSLYSLWRAGCNWNMWELIFKQEQDDVEKIGVGFLWNLGGPVILLTQLRTFQTNMEEFYRICLRDQHDV